MEENENDDPVGCQVPRDPAAKFTELAAANGVTMTPEILDLCHAVAELCACLVEPYGDSESGGNAADEIRAALQK